MTRESLEWVLQEGAQWLRLGIELIGAIIVGIGALLALWLFVRSSLARRPTDFNPIRLVFARHLALALEFQLAADIVSTAVSPKLEQIAQLAAIAVIRTGLNFFLGREIKEEQAAQEERAQKIGQDAKNEGEPIAPQMIATEQVSR